MNENIRLFMEAILGNDAFSALFKAGERYESLSGIINPRAIVGWANLASRWSYDGTVPGIEDSILRFAKSESGLTGFLSIGEQQLDFENANAEHLAAILCVSLGCSTDLYKSEPATFESLGILGQNIDLMVKARVINLLKAEETKKPSKVVIEVQKDLIIKQDTSPPQFVMTKSMSESRCTVCESTQFSKAGEFKGCFCLRSLARFVKAECVDDGYLLTFGPEWGKSHIRLLSDIVRNKAE